MKKAPSRTPTLPFADPSALQPLAERMRPRTLDEIVGQRRLLAPTAALRRALEAGRVHSMILWGPPGCGKTTLARLVASRAEARFVALSAVMSGLPEVRAALAEADREFQAGQRTVLFIDEVHRFNKAQQDAFLPAVERGSIVLVGATTENPSFELNSALLSRCRVHVLDPLSADDLVVALRAALEDAERGLGGNDLAITDDALRTMAEAADGDVRRALSLLEIAAELAENGRIDEAVLAQVLADRTRRFDKGGEQFYDQISALHKSVRNSNPDAALYWFARMLDGGVDPHYLARRLTRMAVEDIGLADPRAVDQAGAAWSAFDRLGSPEGDLALAQLVLYLALAPKSNAAYVALGEARADIARHGTLAVPLALRNAPTRLMRGLGYGRDYQYDPDSAGGIALDQECFPEELGERAYYRPVEAGVEARWRERLEQLREARRVAVAAKRSADGASSTRGRG